MCLICMGTGLFQAGGNISAETLRGTFLPIPVAVWIIGVGLLSENL